MPTNGIITKVAVGLGCAGIVGAVGVFGNQMAMSQTVEATKEQAEKTALASQVNAIAIGKVVQWIEIDRERTDREHKENTVAHKAIMDKLDKIEEKVE